MTIIICYAKCVECQFGEHVKAPHTWMDIDDRDHAHDTGQFVERYGNRMPTWDELVQSHPCGCYCQKKAVRRDP